MFCFYWLFGPVKSIPTPAVFNREGRILTTSRDVADYFGKNHRDVLAAIDDLIGTDGVGVRNFTQTLWTNSQNGQTYREYAMDRDGFTLLVMGFTGAKARKFKLAYITEFNRMEAELNSRQQAPDGLRSGQEAG